MVVSSRWRETTGCCAGMGQQEAAGAVGALDIAGAEAALAQRRRLLIAGHARDRHGRAQNVRGAEALGVAAHLRQHGLGHIEKREQLRTPGALVDIEEIGARGVGGVGGVEPAAGQAPDEKAVDRAEGEVAPLARAGQGIEQPGELGRREIGVDQEAAALGNEGLPPLRAKPVADGRRAPVLPDDGVVQAGATRAVPEQHRLALVGDADGGRQGVAGRLAQHRDAGLPDLFRVVLHPAGRRVDLAKLALGHPERRAGDVEQDRAGRGGALVEGEQERAGRHDGHASPHFSPGSRPASRPGVRSARSGPKSVSGYTVEARDDAGGHLGATRRAAPSSRQRASRRLPDVPHRAARLSYPVGRTAPRRP